MPSGPNLNPSSEDCLLLTAGPYQTEAAAGVEDVERVESALLEAFTLEHHPLQQYESSHIMLGRVCQTTPHKKGGVVEGWHIQQRKSSTWTIGC